jgi:hypothetical protein
MMKTESRRGQKGFLGLVMTYLIAAASLSQAMAQEQRSSPTSRGEGGSAGEGDEFGRPGAPVAQVGAGTTDGSTTGYSGPESNVQAAPGENSLPPLPSADVCEPYRDTPAYQSCLWVVLRDSPEEEPAREAADD